MGHSGSTLLDIILGGHSNIVGLGEVGSVLSRNEDGLEKLYRSKCSCGKRGQQCEFWGSVLKELEIYNDIYLDQKYKIVLDAFRKIFGANFVFVDSSKSRRYLHALLKQENLNVSVLHIMKDVRSFTISAIDNANRKLERNQKVDKYGKWYAKSSFYHYLRWYQFNKEIVRYLNKNNIRSKTVSYENLCFHAEENVKHICNFIQQPYQIEMLNPLNSHSHVITGNRMRFQVEKRKGISYDNRWFGRKEWLLPSILLPHIMRFNNKCLYDHVDVSKWEK